MKTPCRWASLVAGPLLCVTIAANVAVGSVNVGEGLDARGTSTGIDVSHHSGEVQWRSVIEAGYSFAYAKATEGDDLLDPQFENHWQQMKAVGLARGAYHFYVTEDDPEEQAHFFLNSVHHEPGDLAPVVDVEVLGHGTQPGLPGRLRRFLELVEEELGVKPMLYTSVNFWNAHVGEGFGEYPLWIAEYEVDAPRLPDGWGSWTLWQWAENEEVLGVEKGADLSRFHSTVKIDHLLIPHRQLVSPPGSEF